MSDRSTYPTIDNSHVISSKEEVKHDKTERTVDILPERIKIRSTIVHGFGRGSKLLGFPTANLNPDDFTQLLVEKQIKHGVYGGYIRVHPSPSICKTVLSIGLNPTFEDSLHPTIECYILHHFTQDFYGSTVSLIIGCYIRDSVKFNDMTQLIDAIKNDERWGNEVLEEYDELRKLRNDPFLHDNNVDMSVVHPATTTTTDTETRRDG